MKNVFTLPTDKPSTLIKDIWKNTFSLVEDFDTNHTDFKAQNIYITSNEVLPYDSSIFDNGAFYHRDAVGDVYIITKHTFKPNPHFCKRIILTTDGDLIKDGVQPIDDEFLEWFVKNPSCESVEVVKEGYKKNDMIDEATSYKYKIIIPKEEPSTKLHKGEVVDESYPKEFDENKKNLYYYKQAMNPYSAEEYSHTAYEKGFIEGYQKSTKWQQEQDNIANEILEYILLNDDGVGIALGYNSKEMIENYFKRINYEK